MQHPALIGDSQFTQLKWQKPCRRCNQVIQPGDEGYYCFATKTALCVVCGGYFSGKQARVKRVVQLYKNPFTGIDYNDAVRLYKHLKAGNRLARDGSMLRASQNKVISALRSYVRKATYRPAEADKLVVGIFKMIREL